MRIQEEHVVPSREASGAKCGHLVHTNVPPNSDRASGLGRKANRQATMGLVLDWRGHLLWWEMLGKLEQHVLTKKVRRARGVGSTTV